MKSIILTRDNLKAYKLRYKLQDNGIFADYIDEFSKLIKFIDESNKGIVFIISNSNRLQKLVKQICVSQKTKKHLFVFICEGNKLHIEADNEKIFLSTYELVHEIVPELKKKLHNSLCCSDTMSVTKIKENIINIFNLLNFPTNIMGYTFISDAVEIMIKDHEKNTCLKKVYDIISCRYNKSISNIEKSIRMAITNFIKGNPEICFNNFHKDRVSNSEFISFMINKVMEGYCKTIA